MHFCYILHSAKLNRYYIGETPNVESRLIYHNSTELNTNSSKVGIPWQIKLVIPCNDRAHALKVEKHIKRMKSKVFIENLFKYPELLAKIVSQNH